MDFKNKLILAPMAGVNCPAFRLMCEKAGADIIYSQMIDPNRVVEDPEKFIKEEINPDSIFNTKPLVIQFITNTRDPLEEAIKILEPYADAFDINFGCAEKDQLGKQKGSFFLLHPTQMTTVIEKAKSATKKPITAKIRSGWKDINALENATHLESLGIAALAIHPRTKTQGYKGNADWKIITEIKEKLTIPIIASGDVKHHSSYQRNKKITNADSVMIGRATIGNPYIFKEIKKQAQPTPKYIQFKEFYELYKKQNRQSFSELKTHAQWFFKTTKAAKMLKEKIHKAENEEELIQCIQMKS